MEFTVGMLVVHPLKPEWGPGKVLRVQGNKVHIYFRDIAERDAKLMDTSIVKLQLAESQADPILNNLPPFVDQGARLTLPGNRQRMTEKQTVEKFTSFYPQGFNDPAYIKYERNYKWVAHEKFQETLGGGIGRDLLKSSAIIELSQRALAVCSKVNLLSPYENMAFHDALQDKTAATKYFSSLFDLLDASNITKEIYNPYKDAVLDLPREEGKARVATWPIATLLPFLAQPDRHMFLKPGVTAEAAESLAFDFHYDSQLNWNTYQSLLAMGNTYRELVQFLGPRDFIDVQSFIWIAGGGYDNG